MLSMKVYSVPETLEDAWELYSASRHNVILGGCGFLRLGKKKIGTGIDLTKLKLDYVKEVDGGIEVGAMTRLRTLETHPLFKTLSGGIVAKSVEQIVGVPFRNTVTVGGSVYGRYGFSDLLTALLVLNAEVRLYKSGVMSIKDFLKTPYVRDLLLSIKIPRADNSMGHYTGFRHSAGDFPILTVAIAGDFSEPGIAVGARPMRAELAEGAMAYLKENGITRETIEKAAAMAAEGLVFGSNMRGSAAYRRQLCRVLVSRGLMEVFEA